jgi:hypothetical protein
MQERIAVAMARIGKAIEHGMREALASLGAKPEAAPMRKRVRLVFLAMALGLSVCSQTAPVYMKDRATGKIAQCGPYKHNHLGAADAASEEKQCIDGYKDRGFVRLPDGLPDPAQTPGALYYPQVTQSTIGHTICKPGWTDTVRPPQWYTDDLKRQQLARGPYAAPHARPHDFVEDNRVPLSLGGAPWWTLNLWPQPIAEAKRKDELEARLHKLVCAHRMSLSDAQDVFIGDWWRHPAYHGNPLPAEKPGVKP